MEVNAIDLHLAGLTRFKYHWYCITNYLKCAVFFP